MDGRELFGLTTPLITTASGAKMGKTAQGAVWLNEDRLSNFDYWQYWRNVDDADVGRFLRLFTELPLDEIERLEALKGLSSTKPRRSWPTRRPGCAGAKSRGLRRRGGARLFERSVRARALTPWLSIPQPRSSRPRTNSAQGVSVVELFQRSGLVATRARRGG